jgi:hypothetical protein
MVELVGLSGNRALFRKEERGVIVDVLSNAVLSLGDFEEISFGIRWEDLTDRPLGVAPELANSALTDLDISVLSSSDRLYTIPEGVVAEAKRGLKWRKEEKRGGTSVGLSTARTLSTGGQIGIKKVRHIAKYFPRHEVDKKGRGYKPGEDGYPSNGRIAWALWGGDAAKKWASAIVEREDNKKSKTAGGFLPEPRIDLNSFTENAEFYIRVRLDGSGIDRLYRIQPDGACHVWDDGCWDDMGNVSHDFMTFDRALDDPYDTCKKLHIPVDVKTAIAVSAIFDSKPFTVIEIKNIEPEETSLFEKSMAELDWEVFDQLSDDQLEQDDTWDDGTWDDGLFASAHEFADKEDATPGVYTSEERSEKASAQVRDKMGRFAKAGGRVVIGGNSDYRGTITGTNGENQTVSVRLDNGNTVEVAGNLVEEESGFQPVATTNFPTTNLDFSGILGEPRVPIDQPMATLPGRLPPLTAPDVNLLMNDWSAWVSGQRLAPEYEGTPPPPFIPSAVPDINTAMGKYYQGAFNPDGTTKPGWNPAIAQNVYNEPLLRDWLDQKYANSSGQVGYHNRGWYTPPKYPGPVPKDPKMSRDQVYSPSNINYWNDRFNPVNFSITAAAAGGLTPETSDVPVMYLAIVAPDDPQAVMELVALVPSSKESTEPISFKRDPGKWVREPQLVNDLKSATPPPVVVLSNEMLSEVVEQIDSVQASARLPYVVAMTDNAIVRALVAAGGLDRNRGNAEELRRYWTFGRGALKIRWNTPGDWTRCYRNLAKYMGPRAKGYCALRHKEMTGVWPGSKYNVGKKKKKAIRSSADIETLKTEEQIISDFTLRARAEAARSRMAGRDGVSPSLHGPAFVIPLVIPEEVETGDGRIFKKGSITLRNLPLPLLWQIKTGQGHDGSVVVGQITYMERTKEGIGNAYGVFDTGAYGREAERLVRHGFVRGVSADMDKFETEDEEATEKSETENPSKINITSARVMAVTIVPKPAFQECFIQIVDGTESDQQEDVMTPDGIYIDEMDPLSASSLVACGVVAGAIPLEPPAEWFKKPKLDGPTPLTIDDDGRVFGHIAAWHVDHIGMAFGTRPPRSRSNYAYFHTGALRTAEGENVPVGQLTLAGGHAGLEASADEAVRHYDDTASAFADVHAGEDAFGIWVAGALRPGTTPEQVRAARASAPSGDWRPINGRLELVAVCQVNVPGFPIARARVASGQVMALVAAGANVLAQMKHDPLAELNKKVDAVLAQQNEPFVLKASEVSSKFKEMTANIYAEKAAELSAKVKKTKEEEEEDWLYMIEMMDDNPEMEMSVVPRRIRERLAREGKAMPDGSFPIRNVADLKRAIYAYGRARPGSKGAVRKHIMRQARGLKKTNMIPEKWLKQYNDHGEEFSIQERALAAAAEMEFKQFTEEERQKLAKKGQALPDGSYPIRNESDLKNAIQAYGRSKPSDRAKVRAHIRKRAKALGKADLIPENWKVASTIDEIADDLKVRAGLAAEFAEIEAVFADIKINKTADDLPESSSVGILPSRDEDGRIKYTPQTQPRDAQGKFRRVLARIKADLGASGLNDVIEKVEEAENLAFGGDYAKASEAAARLIDILERLDTKALNPEALENIKNSTAELGEVIANLPFAFGEEAQKIRFSDVPQALQDLMKEMISRVEEKIGQEDADIATQGLKAFMSGSDLYNQSEISSEMSKLLRLLT